VPAPSDNPSDGRPNAGVASRTQEDKRSLSRSSQIPYMEADTPPERITRGAMREEFPAHTRDVLAKRVASQCSNPGCRQRTSGPHDDPNRAINVGVAAHITAASPGGPRYDPALSPKERRSPENGIWLCQTCSKLVDSDESRYSLESLRAWKRIAEAMARGEIEQRRELTSEATPRFMKAEQLVRGLLMEMRTDLAENPLAREFVVLKRAWSYSSSGPVLVYYLDDHPELENKLRILQNLGLIQDNTFTNVKRFVMTEELADYLVATNPGPPGGC